MNKILYVGGFILPDKNAAASRVINNAKALNKNGNEVIFINYDENCNFKVEKEYYGFKCYEFPKMSLYDTVCKVDDILIIIKNENITHIIMYNYPLIGMWKLMKYCRSRGIKCIGDISEWYVGNHGFFYNILKNIESNLRMIFLNKKLDSIIAISQFLYDYYKKDINTIKVPPLVDISDSKWGSIEKDNSILTFCFVGSVNKQKERLDYIVESIAHIDFDLNFQFKIVGISKDDFEKHYNYIVNDSRIIFLGKVNNAEAIKILKSSDWTLLIKDVNLVTTAGFPTKVAESISAGVPIIANEFSNIFEYLNDTNSIKVNSIDDLSDIIVSACKTFKKFDTSIFDYNNYLDDFKKIL